MWKRLPCVAMLWTALALPLTAQTISSGNWSGGPYRDKAGRFGHCYISGKYLSGITVWFAIQRDWGFTVAFTHPNFNVKDGAPYNVTLRIDSWPPRALRAKGVSTKTFGIFYPPSRITFDQFRWGREFQLADSSNTASFRLDGTAVALDRLASCVHANIGGINPYAPAPSPPPATSAPSSPPAYAAPVTSHREKVVTLVANIFVQAGLSDMQMLAADETPAALKFFDLAWKGPGLIGAAKFFPPTKDLTAKTITDDIIASDAKSCPGKFLSGVRPEETQDGAKFRRVFVKCEDMLASVTSQNYVVFGNAERGYYLIGTITRDTATTENADKPDPVDESIARVTLQRIRSGQ